MRKYTIVFHEGRAVEPRSINFQAECAEVALRIAQHESTDKTTSVDLWQAGTHVLTIDQIEGPDAAWLLAPARAG